MLELKRQGLPAARRSALHDPRIGSGNDPEVLLEPGNHFLHDRVAVGSIVGGIDGV